MLPNSENASFEPSGDQVGSVAPQVTLSDSEASVTARLPSRARQPAAKVSAVILLDSRVMQGGAARGFYRLADHQLSAGEIGVVEVGEPAAIAGKNPVLHPPA